MNLYETILEDLKKAMKDQNKFKLSVLRMLKSALQIEKINKKDALNDDEVIMVIKKNVKQRKDSIQEFIKFNKNDEVMDLEQEINILKEYLPEELNEEEIDSKVEEAFLNLKPESIKDMGSVMKYLTEQIGSVADMSLVSQKVKEKLQKI